MTFYKVINASNADWSKAAGTSLSAYMDIGFDELVEHLGPPMGPSLDNKVDAYWYLIFDGGKVATIYNYKDGPAYLGPNAPEIETKKTWHIGSKSPEVLKLLAVVFPDHKITPARETMSARAPDQPTSVEHPCPVSLKQIFEAEFSEMTELDYEGFPGVEGTGMMVIIDGYIVIFEPERDDDFNLQVYSPNGDSWAYTVNIGAEKIT